jgi:hypothetical protein
MNVDVFIRSYYKDFRWLSYCLRSIRKYAHGFRKTVLVVPASSAERLTWFQFDREVEAHVCEDFADDYLGQQISKLQADEYSDADFICHIDSDCLFRQSSTPQDFFYGGKVVIPITSYKRLPNAIGWRRLNESFMQRAIEYDFMRRQPLIFPRWLYPALRSHVAVLHQRSLYHYVMSQPSRGFSEYNALGALAYYFYNDAFVWRERDQCEPDESVCRWFWSWGGLSATIQDEIDAILP